MNNKIALASLSMDLKRVALSYYRGSEKVANRFFNEAVKRKQEIDPKTVKPYIRVLLEKFEKSINQKDKQKAAEELMTYSILFQNAVLASDQNSKTAFRV